MQFLKNAKRPARRAWNLLKPVQTPRGGIMSFSTFFSPLELMWLGLLGARWFELQPFANISHLCGPGLLATTINEMGADHLTANKLTLCQLTAQHPCRSCLIHATVKCYNFTYYSYYFIFIRIQVWCSLHCIYRPVYIIMLG